MMQPFSQPFIHIFDLWDTERTYTPPSQKTNATRGFKAINLLSVRQQYEPLHHIEGGTSYDPSGKAVPVFWLFQML